MSYSAQMMIQVRLESYMCSLSGIVLYVPTNTEVATVSNPVLSTSTADESEEPIQVATFDNTGIFLTPSHCEFVNWLLPVQLFKY